MKRFIYSIFAVASLLLCASCAKDGFKAAGNDEIVVIPTLRNSRTVLVPAGDLTDSRIHIDGYNATSGSRHLDANTIFDSGSWKFYTDKLDVHYYWPQNSNLDVMAYSPAKLDNTCMEVASKSTVTCTGLPMTGEGQEGELLYEFVCGYKGGCKKSDGAIVVPMCRPFAIVNFYLDEAVRSVLKKIEITGIYSQGIFDVESGLWNLSGDKGAFVCNVNKEYPVDINNASHLGGPFIVIPQDLRAGHSGEEVKLVVTYVSKGNAYETITETTLGEAVIASTKIGSWESGKEYNYWISLNGAANEIHMSVTIGEWQTEGNSEVEVK